MNEIRKLWDSIKNVLHHGPSTKPLWQAMIDKLNELETRIKAIEEHPAVLIPPLTQSGGQLPPPIQPAPDATTEQHIPTGNATVSTDAPVDEQPETTLHDEAIELEKDVTEQTAAESATDSSAAGENPGPDSPTGQPSPDGAGQDNAGHAHEELHDLNTEGQGEQHGE